MKIILAGSSGFIGLEVLHQALSNPTITSLIALSRRPLPITSPKLKTVLLDDFASYSPTVLQELSGAESCIWTLGVKRAGAALARKVSQDYTLAAANAFSRLGDANGKPFRFVFTSGVLAVRDQEKPLWIMGEARKIKGEGENIILAHGTAHAAVLAKSGALTYVAAKTLPTIKVDVLAATMLQLALEGAERKVWENAELVALGTDSLRVGVEG